jgi:hypothetical protein
MGFAERCCLRGRGECTTQEDATSMCRAHRVWGMEDTSEGGEEGFGGLICAVASREGHLDGSGIKARLILQMEGSDSDGHD